MFKKGIFGYVPASERVMPVAAKAVAFARQNQFRIIHVGLGFSTAGLGRCDGRIHRRAKGLIQKSKES
jgi:hypothetical protein